MDDRPYVFTKGGVVPDRSRPAEAPVHNLRPFVIRREIEASLARLGVDRIDLYQFHWPDEVGTLVEDSWAEMGRLVDEGKVRYAGVCNFGLELLDRAEAVRHVDSLQPPFSLIRRESGGVEIPWAADHETGVIVYSPMQSGILTDSFSAERVARMAERDWRRQAPNFTEPALSRNLALRDVLRPIAERHGTTVSAVAIGWVLAWPGVTGAIVGARSPEQVDGWIGGATIRLTEDDLAEIATAVDRLGVGSGPVHSLVSV
jgi:aryl-alcohol dehydrogenase-like predicted oxidoreductase